MADQVWWIKLLISSKFQGKSKASSGGDDAMAFYDEDTLVNEHTFADGMLVLFEFVKSWTSVEIGGNWINYYGQ